MVEWGTSGKRIPEGFFDKVCVLTFAPQNRVRSILLEFLEIVEGGPLLNVFLRALSTKFAF